MISVIQKGKEMGEEVSADNKMMTNADAVDFCTQVTGDPEQTVKRSFKKFIKNMFRSKSADCMKVPTSGSTTKSAETSAISSEKPKRRFVRVAKDSKAVPPEVFSENPHVIYKYSQEFLAEHYDKNSGDWTERPLPYTTSGHTILKKSSTDPTPSSDNNSPTVSKHATFKDVVEVHEYSGQDVVSTDLHIMSEAKLYDDESDYEENIDASDEAVESKKGGFFLDDDENDDSYIKDEDRSAEMKKLRLDLGSDENKLINDVDIDRVDGIRKNIFSAMGNPNSVDGVAEAKSEPAKRVRLAELILQDSLDDSGSDSKDDRDVKSKQGCETKKRVKSSSLKDLPKESKQSSRTRRSSGSKNEKDVDVCFDFAC